MKTTELVRGWVRRICVGAVFAASAMAADKTAPLVRGQVAWLLERIVDQSGDRLRKPDKERWAATVDVFGAKGAAVLSGVKVTMEWPGKVALEQGGTRTVLTPVSGKPPGLQGAFADLAEILAEDTLDGFLALHQTTASTKVIGTGYPDPTREGSGCHVVSLLMPGATKDRKDVRGKQYWFDIRSRRLVRVTHATAGIEVRMSDWVQTQGNEFAGTMAMYEGGVLKYTVRLAPTGIGPAISDGLFGQQ